MGEKLYPTSSDVKAAIGMCRTAPKNSAPVYKVENNYGGYELKPDCALIGRDKKKVSKELKIFQHMLDEFVKVTENHFPNMQPIDLIKGFSNGLSFLKSVQIKFNDRFTAVVPSSSPAPASTGAPRQPIDGHDRDYPEPAKRDKGAY